MAANCYKKSMKSEKKLDVCPVIVYDSHSVLK